MGRHEYQHTPQRDCERGLEMIFSQGKQFAIAFAKKLTLDYPEAKNVQDLMDTAMQAGRFENKEEMLAVWGRVCRLLPQKEMK